MKTNENRGDRSLIEDANARLPLPELLRALEHTPPSGEDGGKMQSPLAQGRRQKTPSFSIFHYGNWQTIDPYLAWLGTDARNIPDDVADVANLLFRFAPDAPDLCDDGMLAWNGKKAI